MDRKYYRSVQPTEHQDGPMRPHEHNRYLKGKPTKEVIVPSSIEYGLEIINRTNKALYLKNVDGFYTFLPPYIGPQHALYAPGKVYFVKRTQTIKGTDFKASTTYNRTEYNDAIQTFELDVTLLTTCDDGPLFLPRFGLLIGVGQPLDEFHYPQPQQQTLDEYCQELKSRLPKSTCHLGIYIVDNHSHRNHYFINNWGRVFKVNVIKDLDLEDGVYINQSNIPILAEDDSWISHSTHHRIDECLFTHKDKKIYAPITLYGDPETALQYGGVITIQEERYNENLRTLKSKEVDLKSQEMDDRKSLLDLRKELLNSQAEVQKLKSKADNTKAKQDKTKGFLGLFTAIVSTIGVLATILKGAFA